MIVTVPIASEISVAIPPTIILGTVIVTCPLATQQTNCPTPLFQQFTGTIHWATGYTLTYNNPNPTGNIYVNSNLFKIRSVPDTAFPQLDTIIVPHDGGKGGSFIPPYITLTPSINEATFVYKPIALGAVPITTFNNFTLVDPDSITYHVTQGPPMSDKFIGGIKAGSQQISIVVKLIDSTTSLAIPSIIAGAIHASYIRSGDTPNTFVCHDLSAIDSVYSSGGWFEIGPTQPGCYRLDLPNAAFIPGADSVNIAVFIPGSLIDTHHFYISPQNSTDIYSYLTSGVNLRSTGFDNISIAPPMTVAQNFREMLVQLYRYFFSPKTIYPTNIKTFDNSGVQEITSQPITVTSQGSKYGSAQ